MQTSARDYWKLFKPSACSVDLGGETKEEVFAAILANLVKGRQLPAGLREPALASLLEREAMASTGVGSNVAIPHVKLAGLEKPAVSLSVHPAGVDWNAVDGEPVHILFAVLRPERPSSRFDPARHLEMMRWISVLARQADFRSFARQVTTRKQLIELLREMSGA